MAKDGWEEFRESLGLTQEFSEKLLRIEELTMLAKNPELDARYQCVPGEETEGVQPNRCISTQSTYYFFIRKRAQHRQ